MAKDCALCGLWIGGLRIGASELAMSRPRTPPEASFRWQIRNLREELRRMHPKGASRTDFEAFPGPAQFQ
eukprot:8029688-Alexandrium_andersonii.AAC.1